MRKTIEALGLMVLGFLFWMTYTARYGPERLPDRIPTHFDISGQPNAWGPPSILWLLPVIGAGLYLLMTALASIRFRRYKPSGEGYGDESAVHSGTDQPDGGVDQVRSPVLVCLPAVVHYPQRPKRYFPALAADDPGVPGRDFYNRGVAPCRNHSGRSNARRLKRACQLHAE